VNKKRIQRLWRLEGLKVPYRKRKEPLRGLGVHVGAMSPIRPNAIWAMDFQFDETRNGRQLKLLNIQDVFTRECLAVHVERSITADDRMDVLDELVARHGAPTFLRCDIQQARVRVRGLRHCRLVQVQQRVNDVHRPRLTLAER
jgi:putative transposase